MTRTILVVVGSLLASSLAFAQDSHFHRNITVGLGTATPVGNATNYLTAAPLVAIGYGCKFNRLFQSDVGPDCIWVANNQNAEVTDFVTLQGGDHEFMIPLGGRVYIAQPFTRIEVSASGSAMYLHYSETVSSNGSDFAPSGYSCTSRGGWGSYRLANVSYFLDRNHNCRVPTTIQYVAGSTNGLSVGNVPGNKTTDR